MVHFPYRAGNYVLFAELGSGTVGVTYIGRQVGQSRGGWRPLVIRVLEQHLSQRPDVVRVFLDEQRAAALLSHPRIAAVHEVGMMPDGPYFMAAEYTHGVPLREVLRSPQAGLTPGQAVHLAMQICDAMHYAHERLDVTGKPLKIVHGQLSPDAIIVGFDGNARVTEFGLLRTRDAATATIPTLLQRRTAFLSPELRGQLPLRSAPNVDRRTDVYSIGALLWEMLTGQSLMPTDEGGPPPPNPILDRIDPQLEAIVLKAMARSPGDRFPTALSLRLALTSVASQLSADGSVATALARSLTVAFRERIVSFQEQYDLWRKFEDDVLPDSNDSRSPSGFGGTQRTTPSGFTPRPPSHSSLSLSGVRNVSSIGPALGLTPSSSSGVFNSQQGGGRTPTPQPQYTPLPSGGREDGKLSRLYIALLSVTIVVILVAVMILVFRPRPQTGGALLIDSHPRGAQILVDGRPAGTTPYRVADIQSASVHIELMKDGYRPWVRQISPQPGKTLSIEVELDPDGR